MCRIAGLINTEMSIESVTAMVTEMCRLQLHGGPDDGGIYINAENNLVLGHRRLSLIDLSAAGHQPMFYKNNRYIITYNGELYNYIELKNTLIKKGCVFNTSSDTEVILAAFATWNTDCFEKFNGMFAFALLDTLTNQLYLVRDAIGIKPLYFAHTANGLAFASEVRAFAPVPYLQTAHPHWPVFMMAYGHLPEPITTLKEVKPLKKGTFLNYDIKTRECKHVTYTNFSYIEQIDDRDTAIELIQQTLSAAVKRHLISDAPIGVFLSGGLDSSILAALANKQDPTLKTVSLIFDEDKYSEKEFQDLMQKKLHGEQYQQVLKEDSFHAGFPEIVRSMDLPSCDGINTWFISQLAKNSGLKAVLSGIGGDEFFGGYPSFSRISTTLQIQKLPNAVLRSGTSTNSKKLRRLCYLTIPGPIGIFLFLRGQFIPNEIAAYLNMEEAEVWKILESAPQLPAIAHLTDKNQASWIESNLYMQNQLLRDADVMSMAHGVEIRLPFLDAAFVKLSLQISSKTKYAGAFKKQLLIDSFKNILPEAVWNRPKMGFTFPFKEWLGRDQYADCLTGTKMGDYHKKFVSGNMHWAQFLTIFLMENKSNAAKG